MLAHLHNDYYTIIRQEIEKKKFLSQDKSAVSEKPHCSPGRGYVLQDCEPIWTLHDLAHPG